MDSGKLLRTWEYLALLSICGGLVTVYDCWLTAGAPLDLAHSTLYVSALSVTLWFAYYLARLAPHVAFGASLARA
jgi:hypothetical protein